MFSSATSSTNRIQNYSHLYFSLRLLLSHPNQHHFCLQFFHGFIIFFVMIGEDGASMNQSPYQLRRKMTSHEKSTPGTSHELLSSGISKKWSESENLAYLQFLKENMKNFHHEKMRRENKIFLEMSYFMGCSKSSEQCRTHHQKALQKYGCLENILNKLQLDL